jgi:uncharacterized membrane protein
MRRQIGYLFVLSLFSILSLLYYTFYWQIFIPLIPSEPQVKYIVASGHLLLLLHLWCLFSVICSEPGSVPPYWVTAT